MELPGISAYLAMLFPKIPTILALFIGIVLALVFRGRYPVVSRLALMGFSILLALLLLGPYISLWLTYNQRTLGWDVRGLGFAMTGIGLATSIIAAIAYGLLIAAVFGWRDSTLMATPRSRE